jgi:RimJ/RimL family protein N-acetyltransferase
VASVIEPRLEEILSFCAEDPIERVFLEDVARRGLGNFCGLEANGRLGALCHIGANVVPSGAGCDAFAKRVASHRVRLIIGEERAVGELWDGVRRRMPEPRADRPGQPVYVLDEPPASGETALRAATVADLDVLVPACAAAHEHELGVDPMRRDPDGFRWRTRAQIEAGRSWIWRENGTILFKAEASAWTPRAVQLQQVWVDPAARGRGYGKRALCDLCRLLLERVPTVCLFVRAENRAAIALYEAIGMRHTIDYRSVLF